MHAGANDTYGIRKPVEGKLKLRPATGKVFAEAVAELVGAEADAAQTKARGVPLQLRLSCHCFFTYM